ncbi:hypothetical protein RDI58_011897 [Solanum bulbocastanum]|uniref:Serpin domain-containing protein n=1 Tax=Solanum bulbocastanum TaxID=147425 RepID=A0AAN8TYY0_SOLBU
MTAVGARGDTLDQMLRFLSVRDLDDLNSKFLNMANVIESNSNGGRDLSFLNGMWVAYTHEIRDSFKHLATTLYKIEPKIVDFKLRSITRINSLWCRKRWQKMLTPGQSLHQEGQSTSQMIQRSCPLF